MIFGKIVSGPSCVGPSVPMIKRSTLTCCLDELDVVITGMRLMLLNEWYCELSALATDGF